ncbi:Vacuolar protein sorting-associated protein 54, chloroplastic [Smittium culicis]|uniref:Vacuolar protein sorting-associated protein 54, chloroplastic n=1 Tax=Smittium culicis TaxID=133412 RepID=A0A1R1XGL0_9FUNG|nr:Vacuolar protein sorting-associated protein 54, chloroplastic [Smittium culicis]
MDFQHNDKPSIYDLNDSLIAPIPPFETDFYSNNSIANLISNSKQKKSRIRRSELTPVKKTPYPSLSLKSFAPYLGQINEEFSSFKEIQSSKAPHLNIHNNPQDNFINHVSSPIDQTNPFDSPVQNLKNFSIENIPPVFFKPDFDIENPSTFSSISSFLTGESSLSILFDTSSSKPPPKPETNLSLLLDNVELNLINEIKTRSSEFFNALSTLTFLSSSSDSALAQINALKSNLLAAKQNLSSTAIDVIDLQNKKNNINRCLNLIHIYSDIINTLPIIKDLVDSHDSPAALALVAEIEHVLISNPDKLSLSNSSSFKSLNRQLIDALSSVSDFAIKKISSSLNSKLADFVNSSYLTWSFPSSKKFSLSPPFSPSLPTAPPNTLSNNQPSSPPISNLGFDAHSLTSYKNNLFSEIKPLFNGLIRIGKADLVLKSFISELDASISLLMEQDYPPDFSKNSSSTDFNDASTQQSLANSLRKISFDDFISLLFKQFSRILLIAFHTLSLIQLTSECYSKNDQGSSPLPPVSRDLINSLQDKIIDTVHLRINKLIIHRKDQISKLNISPFYSFFCITRSFIFSFERLVQKSCTDLRNCLILNSKLFLENLHNEKTKQLLVMIENEQWVQTDAPSDFQIILDNLVASAAFLKSNSSPISSPSLNDQKIPPHSIDSQCLASFSRILKLIPISLSFEKLPQSLIQKSPSLDSSSISEISKNFDSLKLRSSKPPNLLGNSVYGTLKQVDQTYPVVGSSLTLLKTVFEYVQLSVHMPNLASHTFANICHILKLYNSRSCQVVLGAGAVISPAALKHISAKNIALVARSLDLVLQQLIQPIRDIFISGLLLLLPKNSSPNSDFSAPLDYCEFTYLQTSFASSHSNSIQNNTIKSQIRLSTDLIVSVEGDYLAHKTELLVKLISIMSDRADMHVAKLASTKWDSLMAPRLSETAQSSIIPNAPTNNQYTNNSSITKVDSIELILSEIIKLYRILTKYLDLTDIEYIFSQITTVYSNKILASLPHFIITTVMGKSQVIRNFQLLSSELGKLKGVPMLSNQLEISANNINLVDDYLPVASATNIRQINQTSTNLDMQNPKSKHNSAPPPHSSHFTSKHSGIAPLSPTFTSKTDPADIDPNSFRAKARSITEKFARLGASSSQKQPHKGPPLTDEQKKKLQNYDYKTVVVGGVEVKVLAPKNSTDSFNSTSVADNGDKNAVSETPNLFGNFIDSPVSPGQEFSTNASSRFDDECDDGEFSVYSDAGTNNNNNKQFTSSETLLQRPGGNGSFDGPKRETVSANMQARALRTGRGDAGAADYSEFAGMSAKARNGWGRPRSGTEARAMMYGAGLDDTDRPAVSSRASGGHSADGRGVSGHGANGAIAAGNSDADAGAGNTQQDKDGESVYSEVSATFITQEM